MPSDVLITPATSKIDFTDGANSTKKLSISGTAFSFNSNLNVLSSTSLSSAFKAEGVNGTLFEVTDDLSNSLMSVNTIGGLPVFEVFANNSIIGGQYGANDFVISGNKIGLGYANPVNKLTVSGSVSIGSSYNVAAPSNGLIVQGNVGIGTASPSARLTIVDNTNGGIINLVGRTSDDTAAVNFRVTSDASTYAYISPDTNEFRLYHNDGFMSFYPGGTEKWRITAAGILESNGLQTIRTNTGNLTLATALGNGHILLSPHGTGNVGVGTASPSLKLDVRGAFNIGGESEGIRLGNVGDNAAYDNVKLYYTGYNSGNPRIYLTPRTQPGSGAINTYLHLLSNTAGGPGANNIGLLVDGNVGIGTVAPAGKLHVYNGSSHFEATSTGAAVISSGLYALQIGPLHDRLTTAGSYYGGIAFNHLLNFNGYPNYNNAPQAWIGTRLQDDAGSERDYLVFATKPGTGTSGAGNDIPIERMCIDRDGLVGIGTLTPSEKLEVVGVIKGTSFAGLGTNLTGTASGLSIGGTATTANSLNVANNYTVANLTATNLISNFILPNSGITGADLYAQDVILSAYHHGDSLRYDAFQFNAPNTFETRATVGSSFVSASLDTSLFKGDRFGGALNIIYGTYQVRWTWNDVGYRYFNLLYLAYSATGHNFTVLVEKSADGVTWTTQYTSAAMAGWPGHGWYTTIWNNNGVTRLRITLTPTWNVDYSIYNIFIYNMRYFCSYPLDSSSRLYDWDYSKNITFSGNVGIGITPPTAKLDVTGSATSGYSLLLRSGDTYNQTDSVQIAFGYANTTNYRHSIRTRHWPGIPVSGVVGNNIDFYVWKRGTDAAADLGTQFVMTMQGDGAVGIGVTNPVSANKLSVSGSVSVGSNYNIAAPTNGLIVEGDIGVGITSPLAKLHVNSTTSGATLLRADGTNGTLFSVVDDLSDSLMSVNNSAGLPVLEVFADDRVVAGQYGANDFVLRNNKIGIGNGNPSFKLDVTGSLGVNAGTSDGNWPFIVVDSSTSGGANRYALNKIGAMGFNYADSYAQLQLIGASGAYIDFGNASVDDADARIFYVSNTRLDLTYGSTVSINSTGVGISKESPSTKLHVYSSVAGSGSERTTPIDILTLESENTTAQEFTGFGQSIVFRGSTYNNATQRTLGKIIHQINDDSVNATRGTSLDFQLLTNGTGTALASRMYIQHDGNVGIGITSPVGKLTVQGNIEVNYNSTTADSFVRRSFLTAHATINRGANIAFGLFDGGSNPMGMTVYNTAAAAGAYNSQFIGFHTHEGGVNEGERMRITSLGNVGIGNITPKQLLHINGNILLDGLDNGYTQSATRGIGYGSGNGAVGVDGFSGMDIQSVNAPAPYNGTYSQNLRFWAHHYASGTGGTPRMFIQYNGNVGIATVTPAEKLDVSGSIIANSIASTDYTRQLFPSGGYFYAGGAQTGAIKIKLPANTKTVFPMLSFTCHIYNYSTGTSRTFKIGGHFSTASWYNEFAYCLTQSGTNLNVRWGFEGTSICVWIGETTSGWSYPSVFITDFQNGYSAISNIWMTGWTVSLATVFDTITNGPTAAGYFWNQNNDGAGSGLDADLLDGYNSATANTANTIVLRDGSGNFSAGTVTGTFAGNITGNVTGNVSGTAGGETFATVTGRGSGTTTQISVGTTSAGSMFTGEKIGSGYSDTLSGATFKSITNHPTGASFAFAAYYGGLLGTNSFYVSAEGGAYFKSDVGIGKTTPNAKLNVLSTSSLSSVFKTEGVNGTLFEVTDDLSNSLMSVNTIGGLPVFEVFANNSIIAGQYGQNDFVISGNKVGIGTSSPSYKLHVNGSLGVNAGTSDGNWPFIVVDSISSGGSNRYALNKIGAMGFNYADSYAQLQLIGANGAYIDFGNAAIDDSDARIIYHSNNRFDISYGTTITLNSTGAGVGVLGPSAKLHVQTTAGSVTTPNVVAIFQANTDTTIIAGGGTAIKFRGVSSGGNLQDYDQCMISSLGYAGNNQHGMQFWVKPNAGTVLTAALTINNDSSVVANSSVTAASFSGLGTNLTGTASSLTAGTATNVAWSGITSKPTTLAGFGITDAMYQSNPNGFTQGDINGSGNMQRLWGTDSVQNLLAFRPPTTVEYTTDNVNWVATSISNNVFDNKVFGKWSGFNMNAGTNVGGWTKVRMTWVNFGYHFFSHFTLCHSTNGHSMNFVFYKSDLNGVFSSESYRVNGISSWPGYTFTAHNNVSGWWDTRDVRMVFELNGNNGPSGYPNNAISIGHIGIMGGYSSFNRLFEWDGNRNIDMYGNLSVAAGTVTALNFSGPGTSLTGTASSLVAGSANAIADGVVSTSAKISNSVVTLAKIENISTGTILGNNGVSAGAPIALTSAQIAAMLSGQTMNINGSSTTCSGLAASATTAAACTGNAAGLSATLAVASGGTGGNTQALGRTGLGATTVGANLFTLANPSAISFIRINAANTVEALNAADFRNAISAGTGNGTVTSVTGTAPIASSGGATPAISLNDAGVTTAKIANSNVTLAKLANISTGHILGNNTGADAAPLALTSAQVVTMLGIGTSSSGTVTNIATGDGLSGGPITATGTITVDTTVVRTTGTQTIGGAKTFSSTIAGSINGNAGSVTDGVYLSTNQSIGGVKTFSSAPVATNIAKAWVYYNMNNNTTYASYNVSSVADNGTGVCTVNFSTAMVDANYVVAGTATYGYDDADIYAMILAVPRRSTAQQAGSCRLATEYIHGAQVYDSVAVRAVFYR